VPSPMCAPLLLSAGLEWWQEPEHRHACRPVSTQRRGLQGEAYIQTKPEPGLPARALSAM